LTRWFRISALGLLVYSCGGSGGTPTGDAGNAASATNGARDGGLEGGGGAAEVGGAHSSDAGQDGGGIYDHAVLIPPAGSTGRDGGGVQIDACGPPGAACDPRAHAAVCSACSRGAAGQTCRCVGVGPSGLWRCVNVPGVCPFE
jgi:hypothetical protein